MRYVIQHNIIVNRPAKIAQTTHYHIAGHISAVEQNDLCCIYLMTITYHPKNKSLKKLSNFMSLNFHVTLQSQKKTDYFTGPCYKNLFGQ